MGLELEGEKRVHLLLLGGWQSLRNQCQDRLEQGRFKLLPRVHPGELHLFLVGLGLDFFDELSKLPNFFLFQKQ